MLYSIYKVTPTDNWINKWCLNFPILTSHKFSFLFFPRSICISQVGIRTYQVPTGNLTFLKAYLLYGPKTISKIFIGKDISGTIY